MKRFYKHVTVAPSGDGFQVMLDGRGIKTARGAAQVMPTQALAEALAAEWAAQGEEIDTASFVLRDLADYAIDVVAPDAAAAVGELVPYAETDTLCYRADEGEPLHERQVAVWEPLLLAAEHRWDIHFERISGIIHRPQPAETLARMETVLLAESAFALAALKMLTSLSASLVIALAAIAPDADTTALWNAANLEEDWQAELWGKDEMAEERRAIRLAAFEAAMRFAALARG
ncbi:MAG: molecular chaperone [Novosphingobium sp.]|nr:molecular chaperone [Novosphingobium sp.]